MKRTKTKTETLPLPETLRKNGFQYTQVCRGVRSFIYGQHVTPEVTYYEVFLLKISPAGLVMGKNYPERERFPGNEAFGDWAWSFRTLEQATEKFNELENNN